MSKPAAPASPVFRDAPLPTQVSRAEADAILNVCRTERTPVRLFQPGATLRAATVEETDSEIITAVINTNDVDRYQTIIDPSGGVFTNFLANPILLWSHGMDWAIGNWPVGNVRTIRPSSTEIEVDLAFDLEGSLGKELDRLYRKGILRGFSIGFIPVSWEWERRENVDILRYTAWELVELSCVSVPGNAKALKRSLAGGELEINHPELLRWLQTQCDAVPDDAPPAQAVQTREAPAARIEPPAKPAINWERTFDHAGECRAAASYADVERMAAIVVQDGENRRSLFLHHHADGAVSWRGLATCMARLLTQPENLIPEQRDAIYDHLCVHYREAGIEPPPPGLLSPDAAYDIALEGRIAHIDDSGYSWMFVEAATANGRTAPGFQRVDDGKSLRLFAVPAIGRLADHRQWGRRQSAPKPEGMEALLQELATNQRMILELQVEGRGGAEFSKKNRERITSAADEMETAAKEFTTRAKSLKGLAQQLRDMVAVSSADEGLEALGGGAAAVIPPAAGPATGRNGTGVTSRLPDTGFLRTIAPQAVAKGIAKPPAGEPAKV